MNLLEDALAKARSFPGMGAVNLFWHPYECQWFAKADWSDNSNVTSNGFNEADDALKHLIELLNNHEKTE